MLTGFEVDLIIKLVIAAFLGGVVGFERYLHKRPGGLRTHALVSMGSALFTIVSANFPIPTPLIAAGIVGGIGFLGAGTIFRSENKVHGLTTAAELWVLAAIGIAVGIGFFAAAVATTVIVIVILGPLKKFEHEEVQARKRKRR
ncbi:MAG: MgtC/SapB family protein [Candidatus Aenigmarchaeota archaeon]|nr:MgtC/SapB family protein [Candidatus Aenigmarchaeota archaeon]